MLSRSSILVSFYQVNFKITSKSISSGYPMHATKNLENNIQYAVRAEKTFRIDTEKCVRRFFFASNTHHVAKCSIYTDFGLSDPVRCITSIGLTRGHFTSSLPPTRRRWSACPTPVARPRALCRPRWTPTSLPCPLKVSCIPNYCCRLFPRPRRLQLRGRPRGSHCCSEAEAAEPAHCGDWEGGALLCSTRVGVFL
jgi:hypothetical protein